MPKNATLWSAVRRALGRGGIALPLIDGEHDGRRQRSAVNGDNSRATAVCRVLIGGNRWTYSL